MAAVAQSPRNLRDARKAAGLTVEAAASLAGCSVRTVQRAEAGEHSTTAAVLARLADTYGVQVSDLFHDADGSDVRRTRGKSRTGDAAVGDRSIARPIRKGE